jgi:3-methyladenine DNA glycosylase AlkD
VTVTADELVERLDAGLTSRADPARVPAMTAYMRDQFPYLGVPAPGQKAAWREATSDLPQLLDLQFVIDATTTLWARDEREYQYVGLTLVNRHAATAAATPELLGFQRTLIRTKPWWDTVDALATRGVGAVVHRYPELRSTMDEWLAGDHRWLTRTALLHMNRWKQDTDRDWLFAACLARSSDRDFFIRKAIGWALREYTKVDERAVIAFVKEHEAELSGLSRREALMWLERRRRRTGS